MLNNFSIVRIIREIALTENHGLNLHELHPVEMNARTYTLKNLPEFERDLTEAGHLSRIIFIKKNIPRASLRAFLQEQPSPVVTFELDGENLKPILWLTGKKGTSGYRMEASSHELIPWDDDLPHRMAQSENGEVLCLSSVIYENPISPASGEDQNLSPLRRLIRLLNTERKEIFYVLFYALLVGGKPGPSPRHSNHGRVNLRRRVLQFRLPHDRAGDSGGFGRPRPADCADQHGGLFAAKAIHQSRTWNLPIGFPGCASNR